jgi:hypothetical protein
MNNYNIAAIFAGILIKPMEFLAEDLISGSKLIELLCFMINHQSKILHISSNSMIF